MSVLIAPEALEAVTAAAEAAYPDEACGVLLGPAGADFGAAQRRLVVQEARPLSNAWEGSAQKRTRYEVSASEIAGVERSLRGTGDSILGFYHSHPDHLAWPSPFDLERAWPFYAYVILSVRGGKLADTRSWRLSADGRSFVEESIKAAKEACRTKVVEKKR